MKQFEKVEIRRPGVSTHNLSFEKKMTLNMGKLAPILVEETLPGDRFRIKTEVLARFQPMLAPIMHRVDVYVHYFFVPFRIIWDDWEDFITSGQDGTNDDTVPMLVDDLYNYGQSSLWQINGLPDYMGLPVHILAATPAPTARDQSFSQLPFRAYQQIYNDYYIDQNQEDYIEFPKGSIDYPVAHTEAVKLCTMRYRAWEKDYFTAALPSPQLGAAVDLPIGDKATVKVDWDIINPSQGDTHQHWKFPPGTDATPGPVSVIGNTSPAYSTQVVNGFSANLILDPNDTLYADLSDATASTINDLRRAYAMQRWMEKNMRHGHRYFEQNIAHFGVKSPDARLQRAEYIGGGKMPVKVSEVLQTSETSASGTAQGNMAGHGYAVGNNAYGKYYCQEHGLIMGIMSVIPRTSYVDATKKFWFKQDKFEFYWPDFAHIGEEPVSKNELYVNGDASQDDTFGYNPRYQEYRYNFDQVCGELRTTLDFWHLSRKFDSPPSLNQDFITCVPSDRIWPVREYDQLIIQCYNDIKAVRPVVKYGKPI